MIHTFAKEVFFMVETADSKQQKKRTYQSAKARKFYKIYEDLGYGRTLQKVAELSNGEISLPQLKRYSTKYDWQMLVKQHDLEQIKLEDALERKRFKELISETKRDLENDIILKNQIRDRLQKDLKNPKVKGTSIANSFECYVNASMNLLKQAHRLYGQAWNIDPLVVNFVQQNNNVQQQNNQLNFLEKLKKNDD